MGAHQLGPAAAPSRDLVVTATHVAAFAAASGDRNPLHLDPLFARRSVYGEPVAHGAVAVLAALGTLGPAAAAIRRLSATFHQPVRAGQHIRITHRPPAPDRGELTIHTGSLLLCTVRYRFGDTAPLGSDETAAPGPPFPVSGSVARVLDAGALMGLPTEAGSYRADTVALQALVTELTGPLPEQMLAMIAWASYWTGMRTPGRDAIWCGFRADFTLSDPPERAIGCRTNARVSSRTGLVTLHADLTGSVRARVRLDSLVRHTVPQASAASMRTRLPIGATLCDRTVLVIGGSRGLGRATAVGCALLGGRVLVVSRDPDAAVADMGAGLHIGELVPVACDVNEPEALLAAVAAHTDRLDGLVLCSSPAIPSLPMDAAAGPAALRFVDMSVRQSWAAFAVANDLLVQEGFLVALSSSAVTQPPAMWPHYTMAKHAVEGLAAHAAAHHPWRVLVARPPRLWTDLTNTATGPIGAMPLEQAAGRILSAALAHRTPPPGQPAFVPFD